MSFPLELGDGVSGGAGGRFQARCREPWLHLAAGAEPWAGHWVKLRYRTGLFDDPVRPLIRFDGGGTVPMNGAVMGTAEWIGRVPDGTRRISFSPTNRPGPFAFALDAIDIISRASLLRRGYARNVPAVAHAVILRAIGRRVAARYALQFAAQGTPLAAYHDWRLGLHRPADGFDQTDWQDAPRLHFTMASGDSLPALDTTLTALQQQHYGNWTLRLAMARGCQADIAACMQAAALADPRITLFDGSDPSWQALPPSDLVACLQAGETLSDIATGAVARAAMRTPEAELLYGDEDVVAEDRHSAPCFKPDYSPHFQSQRAYIGGGAFLRAGALAKLGCESPAAFLDREADWLARLLSSSTAVRHVRRVVYHRPAAVSPAPAPLVSDGPWPEAAIVIPSRDRASLLAACIESLLTQTDYPALRIVVVDNGSVQPKALALLGALAKKDRVTVLRAPGPFNFSALCNLGARATDSPLLVFLNNDIQARQADWLKRLAGWARRPGIAAVGARLVYPDGRVQAAGDIVGIGEAAANAYKGARDADDYLGQLSAAHEVSAVTGALMVMERKKFEAAGGFDAFDFPVSFSDTDLCLKLAGKGLRGLVDPSVSLVHLESVSRGRRTDMIARHRQQQMAFQQRWMGQMRDDPCFHPVFCLWSFTPRLA